MHGERWETWGFRHHQVARFIGIEGQVYRNDSSFSMVNGFLIEGISLSLGGSILFGGSTWATMVIYGS